MIKIITDSAAALPRRLIDEYDIYQAPQYTIFGDEVLRDGIDLTNEQFYARLAAADELPVTNPVTQEDFKNLYTQAWGGDPRTTILSIHISAKLSLTVEAARMAAAELPDIDIRIFDTQSAFLGQGLMVAEAARMARQKFSAGEILKRLALMRYGLQFYAVLDTLDYLAKGGRIGRAQHLVGTLLDMKPILTQQDGMIASAGTARTRKRGIEKIRELALEAGQGKHGIRLGVMHAVCEEEAQQLADELRAELQPEVLLIGEIGPAIGSHVGSGMLGLCWYAPQ